MQGINLTSTAMTSIRSLFVVLCSKFVLCEKSTFCYELRSFILLIHLAIHRTSVSQVAAFSASQHLYADITVKNVWMIKFNYRASVQYKYFVRIHHCIQSMCNLINILQFIIYCASTFAVASSNTSILLFRIIALAKHTNCLCPTLKLDPPSDIFEFRPLDKSSTTYVNYSLNGGNNLVITHLLLLKHSKEHDLGIH
ncbi:hypothetical protein AGLY_005821 [Aphis glycines]|uniref:Uncharacterized protein n=1 Tax=Aphis glycines TaxID=307491 RepID=A0A6G0TT98_APHGL|nr:hypothetical protein AGLY_005821 [Aphis glycines]